MKIVYDHLCFWEKYGGVSRYFVELLKNLPEQNTELLVKFTNNEYVKELTDTTIHGFFEKYNFKGKARLISEIGKLFSVPVLVKGDFDIYHPTHYDTYGLSLIPKRVKTVATIHDMNYFVIPSFYGNRLSRIAKFQSKMAKTVDHIITISQNSKNDIINHWNIPEDKISVIYHGINAAFNEAYARRICESPYILFVGRRSGYKNFKGILKAFSILASRIHDINLVIAGLPFTSEENCLMSNLKILDKCHSIQASDAELKQLYAQAELFVFPSFYEGFGMPVLEAMANRCPVALSNASCFPEIAQDSALYFNPEDIEDMADKMESIIHSRDIRQQLIERGEIRVKEFSWEKCAQEHMKVYESLI